MNRALHSATPAIKERTMRTTTRSILASLVLALAPAACNLLDRPAPNASHFMLAVPAQSPAQGAPLGSVAVRRAMVQRPYDVRGFVYRTTEGQWRVDAYNGFLADPSDMVTEAMVAALRASTRFSLVAQPSVSVSTDLVAESVVEEFFSDFSGNGKPVAKVRIRTYLLERGRLADPRAVLVASGEAELADGSPGAVSDALGVALARAIDGLVSQLPKVAIAPTTGG